MDTYINAISGQTVFDKFETLEVHRKIFIFKNIEKIVSNEEGRPRVLIRFYGTSIGDLFTMRIHVVDLFLLKRIHLEFSKF